MRALARCGTRLQHPTAGCTRAHRYGVYGSRRYSASTKAIRITNSARDTANLPGRQRQSGAG